MLTNANKGTYLVKNWQKHANVFYERPLINPILEYIMDFVKVDTLARRKNSKRHFLKDIEISFHEVTQIGLEPHQIFFLNFSTNTVARDIQSCGQNGPWLAGCLSYGENLFVKFADT